MIDFNPNKQQEKLINNLDGILLSDAGPGTGKTFTISLRYANILSSREVTPEDILLITFTNNAAENMKERIINNCEYDKSSLREAPISTFHSLCNGILQRHGFEAPTILGIDDRITHTTKIIENEVLELEEFNNFIQRFIDKHPEYTDFYRIIRNFGDLLGLIKSLAAKGIFPKKEGWFRNSERYLEGDYQEFLKEFKKMNEQEGNRQSELRSKLNRYKNKCFVKSSPRCEEIRGEGKKVPKKVAQIAFEEDRNELKQFVHDLYFGYVEYALSRNYMNFSFIMMFTFALLCENHSLREKLRKEYVMIDEFQDTNEIQFKLALLLSKIGNICVVGDWKQSIFGFQYASVENIIKFKERLRKYKDELNDDYQRIDYSVDEIEETPLKENFRSTQDIIDFSEQALWLEATKKESLNIEEIKSRITHLEAAKNEGPTEIEAFVSEDQKEAILTKIIQIVNDPDYRLEEQSRKLDYNDIAVLVRKRKFGLELLKKAQEYNIPVAYEGGIELFRTRPSILLLAWLRVLENRESKRGWSVILEQAGYNLDEIRYIFEMDNYPQDMLFFLNRLKNKDTIGAVAGTVFDKYGIQNGISDKIIEVLQSCFDSSYMNTGDIVNFIEENIESGQTYEVDSTEGENVFTIQTIHSAKGLEYPVVFLPDVTARGGISGVIDYNEPIGLRQSKIYSEEEYAHIYDNWKVYVLNKCIGSDYDEERRLQYVAMTRAENYLFLTADEDDESEFFNNMDITAEKTEPELEVLTEGEGKENKLGVSPPKNDAPVKVSAHAFMDTSVLEEMEGGMGTEYGKKVHEFAEDYIRGKEVKPENQDEKNLRDFLQNLSGELITEERCLLPVKIVERKILIEGVIDLINKQANNIQIIDYKTDRDKSALYEYRKQLSIYYHVLKHGYKDKEIKVYIYYTANSDLIEIDPLELGEIKNQIKRIVL